MKRECNVIGCNELIKSNEKYCKKHKREKNEKAFERMKKKEYKNDNYVRKKTDFDEFYNTYKWQKLRIWKQRENPLCERCLKKGILKRTDVIHHKIPLEENYDLRLDCENLESLCNSCHNHIHKFKGVI